MFAHVRSARRALADYASMIFAAVLLALILLGIPLAAAQLDRSAQPVAARAPAAILFADAALDSHRGCVEVAGQARVSDQDCAKP